MRVNNQGESYAAMNAVGKMYTTTSGRWTTFCRNVEFFVLSMLGLLLMFGYLDWHFGNWELFLFVARIS